MIVGDGARRRRGPALSEGQERVADISGRQEDGSGVIGAGNGFGSPDVGAGVGSDRRVSVNDSSEWLPAYRSSL